MEQGWKLKDSSLSFSFVSASSLP
jgi:hypothetical protein